MHTDIAELVGSDVLGGALQGRHACAKLSELACKAPDTPAPWFWDLRAVKAASASFIRECFIAQHAILRAQRSTLHPVIANANPDVREDVRVMYKDVGKAAVVCRLDGRGRAADIGLLGHLESYADATFAMVVERGETVDIAYFGHHRIEQPAIMHQPDGRCRVLETQQLQQFVGDSLPRQGHEVVGALDAGLEGLGIRIAMTVVP